MFILESVRINGFWGDLNIDSTINSDVNIYIGDNGTGKTTYINILYSLLTVDINLIANMQFNSVEMILKSGNRTRKISINKEISDMPYVFIRYKIGKFVYRFPLMPKDIDYNRRRMQHPQYIEMIKECKETLDKLVNISWISVYRDNYIDSSDEFFFNKREQSGKLPIDSRLESLIVKLTKMQLQLESKVNACSKKFQRNVLEALLYNTKFDSFNFNQWRSQKHEKIKEGLTHAYRDLGVFDDDIENKIDSHSKKIQKSLELVVSSSSSTNKKPLKVEDVLPLVLLNRTNHIIDLSKKLEEEKTEIFRALLLYKKVVEEFFVTKEIELDQIRNGVIRNRKNGKLIPISDLSSGEKQLLIILTEALLQQNERFIFIADEPELSLHITWQKKLLKSIRQVNPNSQIIVATHSPEIAALWETKIINMESVFNHE